MNRCAKIFCIVFLFASGSEVYSQPITWQRTYGGNGIQYGYGIVQTPDGGYIAVGRKFTRIYVLRLNPFGDTIWTREYPGFEAKTILKTSDNNYVILGAYSDVIKINLSGETIWNKNFDSNISSSDIQEASDGSLIICRTIPNGFLRKAGLLKLNQNGDIIFSKTYLNNYFDLYFTDIEILNDSSYLICGSLSDTSLLSNKFFILKTDTSGKEIKQFNYDTLSFFYPQTMIISSKNEILVGGGKNNHSTICVFDNLGTFLYKKIFDSTDYSECNSIIATHDNGFVFTGTWDSSNSTYFLRVYKLDSACNEEWRKSYGFIDNDVGYDIKQTVDSGFITIGIRDNFNNGDIYIIKTNQQGYANPFVKVKEFHTRIPASIFLFQNYPNPFNPSTIVSYEIQRNYFVTLKIFDITGKEIMSFVNNHQSPGLYDLDINFSYKNSLLSNGIYFYSLFLDGKIFETKKMILLK